MIFNPRIKSQNLNARKCLDGFSSAEIYGDNQDRSINQFMIVLQIHLK